MTKEKTMYKTLTYTNMDAAKEALVDRKIVDINMEMGAMYLTLDNGNTLEIEVEVDTGILDVAIAKD